MGLGEACRCQRREGPESLGPWVPLVPMTLAAHVANSGNLALYHDWGPTAELLPLALHV